MDVSYYVLFPKDKQSTRFKEYNNPILLCFVYKTIILIIAPIENIPIPTGVTEKKYRITL